MPMNSMSIMLCGGITGHASDCQRELSGKCHNLTDRERTIMTWLLEYAWMDTIAEQAQEVRCIMAQSENVGELVALLTDKYQGQAFDDAQAAEAHGFALSALYECHDGPHLTTCPRNH